MEKNFSYVLCPERCFWLVQAGIQCSKTIKTIKFHISGCSPLTFFLCISEGVFYCPCCSLTTEYPAFLLHPFCCRTKSGKPNEQIQAGINAVPCISRDSDGMAHPYRGRGQAGAIMVLLFWCGSEQPGANHGEVEFL